MRTRPARFFGDRTTSAPAATAGALLVVALVTGLGIAFTNSEGLVAKGFTAALSAESVGQSAERGSEPLVAGSEEFWLTDPTGKKTLSGGRMQPAAWSPQVALGVTAGDRITITSDHGVQRALEVISVSEVPASVTRLETDKSLGHQVLVTCRESSAGQDGQLVRFLTYTGQTASGSPAKPQRTL